jgi:hypothetical protein
MRHPARNFDGHPNPTSFLTGAREGGRIALRTFGNSLAAYAYQVVPQEVL